MLQLNGITKTYLVGVQLFPDHCPPSPICLTDPTKVEWSSLSPSWRLAWTEVFGSRFAVLQVQSSKFIIFRAFKTHSTFCRKHKQTLSQIVLNSVILHHASSLSNPALHHASKLCNITMRTRNETAHAQYTIMVKGGGCKKVMRALMRN